MESWTPAQARRELARRGRVRRAAARRKVKQAEIDHLEEIKAVRSSAGLLGSMVPEALAAFEDESDYIAIQASRRATKTSGAIQYMCADGEGHPSFHYAYVARTQKSAMQIVWPICVEVNEIYGLGASLQEAKLKMTLPDGGALHIFGADRKDRVDDFLGPRWRMLVLDEAPAFGHVDIKELLRSKVGPSVIDHYGRVFMMSNPGFSCTGYFHDVVGDDSHMDSSEWPRRNKGWSVHKWGWESNPGARDQIKAYIARQIADDPEYMSTSEYLRAYENRWVQDLGKLVYHFDEEVNGATEDDFKKWERGTPLKTRYVLGFDLGYWDPCGFVVNAWRPDSKVIYQVESQRLDPTDRANSTEQVAAILRYYREMYPGILLVGDPEKKKAMDALNERYGLPIIDAQKSDKQWWIEQRNDDSRAGRIKVVDHKKSVAVAEKLNLTWREGRTMKRIEDPTVPNHASDADLYSFRECRAHRGVEPTPQPVLGSAEYAETERVKMRDKARAKAERRAGKKRTPFWMQ